MKKLLVFASSLLLLLFFMIRCSKDGPDTVKVDPTDKGYLGLADGTDGVYSGGTSSGNGDSTLQDSVAPGQITAGEWNDLENWDFWLDLGQNGKFDSAQDNWNFYPQNRYSFLVKDLNNNPLADCEVILRNQNGDAQWKSRTDNEGKAELWLNLNGQNEENPSVAVSYGGQQIVVVDPVRIDKGSE